MAPVSWMPISAAATQLGLSMEQVEQLAANGSLHGKAIGGDHLSISAKSVQDYLTPVDALCVTDSGVARHIRDTSREGRSLCGRLTPHPAEPFFVGLPMCGQCVRLRDLKTTSSAPELATPSGDDLAAADDEDFMSAHLAGHPDTERVVPVGDGPELDPQTEFEYDLEKNT